MDGPQHILVAPLDWGLGHATRCIPLIRKFTEEGHRVTLAANGAGAGLLAEEFPELEMLQPPSYRVRYYKKAGVMLSLLLQAPGLFVTVWRENRWLKKTVTEKNLTMVVSDNRFGLFHPKVRSVFITHQLHIPAPFFSRIINRINYHFIGRFSECWVPDHEGPANLSGKLGHPETLPPVKTIYIGPLSRFTPLRNKAQTEEKKSVLFLVSGPENHRTRLETTFRRIIAELPITMDITLVCGTPGEAETLPLKNGRAFPHLNSLRLSEEMKKASLVVGRAGYSSIMDIEVLQKRSLLIPTPGQQEQEYLAQHLAGHPLFFFSTEETLSAKKVLSFFEGE